MSTKTHEKGVEKFYSHGSETRCNEAEGFLSFGYRTDKKHDYFQAAKNLLAYIVDKTKLYKSENILNVACGYGAETFRIFDLVKPKLINAIDITKAHIEFAKDKAKKLYQDNVIVFEHKDACNTGYPDNHFSHVLGVEGIAHFNSREKFFTEAYRVLKDKGEMILTDIVVKTEKFDRSFIKKQIAKFGSNVWKMPRVNWGGIQDYKTKLEMNGFKVEFISEIGEKVYEGFAKFNLRRSSVINAIRQRGFFVGMGLTFISWFLAYAYKRGYIEYVLVKATKI